MAYKIGAKVFQCRLTPILHRIISPQQSAFLPGKNIHHLLVILGEILHQAAQMGEEYVLLKLDVVKAFDCLEWPFLMAVLEKAGFSGILTSFLRASFAHVSSSILLNGVPTCNIPLARSVRQGCPLSPLLFILAFDVLSNMLQQAMDQRRIVGVTFCEGGHHFLQNMFADDANALIRALYRYIKAFQEILHIFGAVLGLVCTWEKTIAAAFAARPPWSSG